MLHVVRLEMLTIVAEDGDTWESIASDRGVTLTALLVANDLDPSASYDPPDPGTPVALPEPPPEVACAPGEDHSLDTAAESNLWVRLDLTPDAADDSQDSVRLYSDDGSVDVTLAIATHYTANDTTVDLLFDSVDPSLRYSIDLVSPGEDSVTLVTDAAFEDLNDDSLPDPPPDSSGPDAGPDDDGDRMLPALVEADLPSDDDEAMA